MSIFKKNIFPTRDATGTKQTNGLGNLILTHSYPPDCSFVKYSHVSAEKSPFVLQDYHLTGASGLIDSQ
jgi:hypothetical protein